MKGPPAPSEYAAFYTGYVGRVVDTDDVVRTLEDQRRELAELPAKVVRERETHRYADGKWTVRQVVGHLGDADLEQWTAEINDEISAAIKEGEAMPPPSIESMFEDVYKDMPPHIAEQMRYAVAMGEGTKFEGAFPL